MQLSRSSARISWPVEKPLGFVITGDIAKSGAKVGAWTGGLFGFSSGSLSILPGFGPLIIAGPLAAALLAGIEGAGPAPRSAG